MKHRGFKKSKKSIDIVLIRTRVRLNHTRRSGDAATPNATDMRLRGTPPMTYNLTTSLSPITRCTLNLTMPNITDDIATVSSSSFASSCVFIDAANLTQQTAYVFFVAVEDIVGNMEPVPWLREVFTTDSTAPLIGRFETVAVNCTFVTFMIASDSNGTAWAAVFPQQLSMTPMPMPSDVRLGRDSAGRSAVGVASASLERIENASSTAAYVTVAGLVANTSYVAYAAVADDAAAAASFYRGLVVNLNAYPWSNASNLTHMSSAPYVVAFTTESVPCEIDTQSRSFFSV